MPRVGFEPTIPPFKRAKTVHALDRAATVIGTNNLPVLIVIHNCYLSSYGMGLVIGSSLPLLSNKLYLDVFESICLDICKSVWICV
jgi:hypothetical protein